MKRLTHLTFGALIGFSLYKWGVGTLCCILGSLIPDMDIYLERRLPKVLKPIRPRWLEHRGVTHWLGLPIILILLGFWIGYQALIFPFALGWISHILLDAMTPMGVPFKPFSSKPRFHLLPKNLRITTGSIVEYFLTFIMISLLSYSVYISLRYLR